MKMVFISKQRGYATVLGVVLMTAIALSVFSLYDVGQVTNDKMHSQNAADAAAYSTAVIVSRDLNFIATTNRAMVANQIAIGQMVGLSSYAHMIEQLTTNIDILAKITSLIPGVGQIINGITKALDKGAEAMKKAFDGAAKLTIPVNNEIIGILSGLQFTFHTAMFASGVQVFNEVARENDPTLETANLVGAYTIGNYMNEYTDTLEYNTGPKRRVGNSNSTSALHLKRFNQFEEVVLDSRDPFLKDRSGSYVFGRIREKGGNEFERKVVGNKYAWQWTAMDTMNVRVLCIPIIGCALKAPLAWGAGHALNGNGKYFNYSRNRGRRWGHTWSQRAAARLAAIDDGNNNLAKVDGLRPFYDLQEDGLRQSGPAMVAILKKPGTSTRVWKEVAKDINGYNLQPSLDVAEKGGIARDQIVTVAKAEPYFVRPSDIWRRSDRREEFGNMYNPFWQPRLVETSAAERLVAMGSAAGLNL
jgi:hypothetical protein